MNRLSRILVEIALEEDLRDRGDLTSRFFVDAGHRSSGRIVSREEAVVSGQEVVATVCAAVSPDLSYRTIVKDGSAVESGTEIGRLEGPTRALLSAERTALNFLQRLSGVATTTRTYCEKIGHTEAVLLDTRKTTPGMRELEKAAVLHGGAFNHRFGLFDAVMVKDNHLVANPSPIDLGSAIRDLRKECPGIKVEVEADRLDQVASFLEVDGIDVILLDNMDKSDLRAAVEMRNGSGETGRVIRLEASGGVNLETISGIAETGVDFISVGALTHSVEAVDFGLDLAPE